MKAWQLSIEHRDPSDNKELKTQKMGKWCWREGWTHCLCPVREEMLLLEGLSSPLYVARRIAEQSVYDFRDSWGCFRNKENS